MGGGPDSTLGHTVLVYSLVLVHSLVLHTSRDYADKDFHTFKDYANGRLQLSVVDYANSLA